MIKQLYFTRYFSIILLSLEFFFILQSWKLLIYHYIRQLQLTTTTTFKWPSPWSQVVLTEDARRFADQMGIRLFETSAKDNINVEEMFRAVTELVLKSKKVNGCLLIFSEKKYYFDQISGPKGAERWWGCSRSDKGWQPRAAHGEQTPKRGQVLQVTTASCRSDVRT